jgi:hypothetical protein
MHHNVFKKSWSVTSQMVHSMWWPLPPHYIPHWKTLEPSINNKISTWSQQVLNIEYLCGSIWAYACFFAVWQIKDDYCYCYVIQCVFSSWKDVSHNMCNNSHCAFYEGTTISCPSVGTNNFCFFYHHTIPKTTQSNSCKW